MKLNDAGESTTGKGICCRFAADSTVAVYQHKLWLQLRLLHLAVGGQAMDQSVAAICCCLQPVTAKNSGCFRCYSAAIISKRRGIPRIGTSGPLFFRGNNSDISDERLGIVRKLAFGVGVALLVWQQIEAEETG